jgi:cell division protein FtsA
MAQSRIILGVDIGSTKIATVVGEMHPSRGLMLRGLRAVATESITRGTVRDLNQAAQDIDDSYSGAMYSSGLSTDRAFIGITGRELSSITCTAMLPIRDVDGEVMAEDVHNVIQESMPTRLPEGQQIVHSMVREFTLDNIRLSRSPEGMIGSELGVETHVVLGSKSQIANLERALQRVDLKVRSYVFNLIAAGEAVLSEEDRTAGCILIDFGGGTTNIGIFHGGALAYSKCIPIGGQNYDHDLKHGLGISFDEAQRIKKGYGKAWIDPDNEELEDFIDIKYYGRREFDKIKRYRVYEIMQPRTEELVEQIIEALEESGELPRIAGGVILVGGACQLRELRRYLQRVLQRQVRIGLPTGIGHLLDEYRTPAFASTLGLLLYGAKHEESMPAHSDGFFGEVVDAIKEMVSGIFPWFFKREK